MRKILAVITALSLTGCLYNTRYQTAPPDTEPEYRPAPPPAIIRTKPAPAPVKPAPKPKPTPAPAKTVAKPAVEQTITLYTASWCSACHALKARLNAKGVKYKEVDVDTATLLEDTKAFIYANGIPAVRYPNGRLTGGSEL